ncbi:hypothetical protein GMORB2_3987 [Geosmithia morbida]|uniref:E3 ubiquitin-protein ligase n=1 Tax=Geosmithia morbida TaxID=1094350 RepID=A0A9P5D2J7_9HYPO|nr:uncharacterized protein GMORB2_3987 [Geosmithia morbida]KAF4125148.1 hypothetical protein GMORB2_3987 [Geosmithia morbida]
MNAIKIPESGVLLKGAPGEDSDPLPQQAFAFSLSDNVIEDMIKCVQDGGDLQLALGSKPTLRYDSKSHRITPPPDDHPYDLYLTQPYNSLREATHIPAMSLFHTPKPNKAASKAAPPAKGASAKAKAQHGKGSSNSDIDSDMETLQNGIAADKAAKETSVLLSGPLDPKRQAKMKNKLSWGNGNTNRSLSISPAIKPISPSMNPTLSSAERVKQQRIPLIHELAVGEQTTSYLQKKWTSKPEDFRPALEKVADGSGDGKKWTLRKVYWKELDVWNYDYDSEEVRQQAIKNAIRQYDKQRLSASDPEWERLNPPDDRGKGICLSALQSRINKASTPSIKVQRADDSPSSRDDGELDEGEKHKSESMSRSSSNPLPKAKKVSASEAQAKRLLSSSGGNNGNGNKTKAAPQKRSPSKPKPAREGGGKQQPLSQEFIENSDSSEDDPVARPEPPKKAAAKVSDKSAARTASKPAEKPVEKPAEKPAAKPTDRAASKPVDRKPKAAAAAPVQRPAATKTAPKRPLSDDDSSSSSGTPLSKRIKPKQPLPSGQPAKKRPLDSRQAHRDAAPAASKNKSTSPTKSSPLAASPPTNASDVSDDPPPPSRKRKSEMDNHRVPPAKRPQVSPDLVTRAQKFKIKYSQYEALHHEISALTDPPQSKLDHLRYMREGLERMKAEIYKSYNA